MAPKVFGTFIAKRRKEKNMTQADLAEKLNVTDKAVSRWERGIGFPDINTIEPLASALEISVPELMKSERILSNEEMRKKMPKKKITGLTRILLTLFAGTNILYTFGNGDRILQTICIAGILGIATIPSFTIWKDSRQKQKALIQGLYCGITVLIAFGFSRIVGNIITSMLIIAITTLYIRSLK